MLKSLVVSSLVLLTVGAGCRSADRRTEQPSASATTSGAKAKIVVDSIDEGGLKKLVGERGGRLLFLNIWATWCVPCVEEFPDLVKLSGAYGEKEVEVVGISADYTDEIETKIIPFLEKLKVPFRVYVAKFAHQEDFINAVNRSWSGALPASVIYDLNGKQRYFHVGQGTFQDFKNEIDKVLSPGGGSSAGAPLKKRS
jgi:thiol-disulfide isomerase/thioredoxin